MDESIRALEARVFRLERQARWSRAAALAALALVVVTRWTPGQAAAGAPEAELQARRFVLVSADGRPLAALEAAADGAPRLSLLNGGVPRTALALAADGSPSLTLSGAGGEERLQLRATAEGGELRVAGSGRSRVGLVSDGLGPRLALADAGGNDRLWVALRLGSPVVQFLDAAGRARSGLTTFNEDSGVAVISAADGKTPGMVVYGKERTIVWSAP